MLGAFEKETLEVEVEEGQTVTKLFKILFKKRKRPEKQNSGYVFTFDNVLEFYTGYYFDLTFLSIRVTVQNEKDRFFVTSTADNLWSKPLDTYL